MLIQVFCFSQTPGFKLPFFKMDFASNKINFSSQYSKPNKLPSYLYIKAGQGNKKPVFCRMEDQIFKRCNVWILFRAGSDEQYRDLIKSRQ